MFILSYFQFTFQKMILLKITKLKKGYFTFEPWENTLFEHLWISSYHIDVIILPAYYNDNICLERNKHRDKFVNFSSTVPIIYFESVCIYA